MTPGTSSTATLFTLPYYPSRSGQIIEPQLNRGSIRSPARRSFVPIYFKKSTRYHDSHISHLPPQCLVSLRGCTHPKQSPGNTQPAISRIPLPHTKRHHLFKTMAWTSSNQNGLVPRIFFESRRYHLSHFSHLVSTARQGSSSFLFHPLRVNPRFLHCEVLAEGACRNVRVPSPAL